MQCMTDQSFIVICKQQVLSIDIWPIPVKRSVIGCSCVQRNVLQLLVKCQCFQRGITRVRPILKQSKITRDFVAQYSLITVTYFISFCYSGYIRRVVHMGQMFHEAHETNTVTCQVLSPQQHQMYGIAALWWL